MQTSLLKGLRTTDVQIRNRVSPDEDASLSITIKKKVTPREDENCSAFLCRLQAIVTQESGSEDNSDFMVSVEVVASLKYEIPNTSFEELQNSALQEIYPHLRAIISSAMAAAGMNPILIPLKI